MKMANLILENGEKIDKFTKINPLLNYKLYGIFRIILYHRIT